MDLTVSEDPNELAKVLTDLRILVKDNLLPRITQLEYENQALRKVCWPVCQALRETSQMTDIENKRMFFHNMRDEEIYELLLEKSRLAFKKNWSSTQFFQEELSIVKRPFL
jgi:hypothetical protein